MSTDVDWEWNDGYFYAYHQPPQCQSCSNSHGRFHQKFQQPRFSCTRAVSSTHPPKSLVFIDHKLSTAAVARYLNTRLPEAVRRKFDVYSSFGTSIPAC